MTELENLRRREAILLAYVERMASQRKSEEMDPEEADQACFVDGFDISVDYARRALTEAYE